MDQSDAGSAGIFSRCTNKAQEARVYSHDGPIMRRKRGYILMMDQSGAGSAGTGSAGIFSQWTHQAQEARAQEALPPDLLDGATCSATTRYTRGPATPAVSGGMNQTTHFLTNPKAEGT
eukprot:1721140-Pyramimonas_sp.AAC.1